MPTGALRIARLDGYRGYGEPTRRSWYDRKGRLVEALIPEILTAFYESALDIKAKRLEDERRRREHEERERLKRELEKRQEANTRLIEQLERDAGAWHRARFLRRYVRAARRALDAAALSALEGEKALLSNDDPKDRLVFSEGPAQRAGEDFSGAGVGGIGGVGTVPGEHAIPVSL